MFQQTPSELISAVLDSAEGEMVLNRLCSRRKMATISELNYELLQLLGAAAALMDEPWAEGEEGNAAQQAKDSSAPEEDSDRPSDEPQDNGEVRVKSEHSTDSQDDGDDVMSPQGAPRNENVGADNQNENDEGNPRVKAEVSDESQFIPAQPKRSKSNSEESKGEGKAVPSTSSSSMGIMEQRQSGKRSGTSRSRGSNLGDSSELEQSETEETDDRRISSRRERDCGSSSRSRTPERPGSDFGGSPGPFSSQQQQQFLQAGIPYLHLLPPHIRNDAARLFLMPQMLPPELAAAVAATATSNQSPSPVSSGNSQTVIPSSSSGKSEKTLSGENSRSGAMFMCEPCNIKFSSARTLEAHQTYYCSFRKDAGREGGRSEVEDVKSELILPGTPGSSSSSKKRDRENCEEHELTMDESMESIESFSMNAGTNMNHNKSHKTGKLYSCIYCSYSADKKVSLNRHMRMHSGLSISATQMPNNISSKDEQGQQLSSTVAAALGSSRPVTPGKSPSTSTSSKNIPDSLSAMERYCQDCDIQFSSIKTFRVHKQYYCSTRHVLKAQQTAVVAALAAAAGGAPTALGKAPVELGPGVTVTPVGKSSASITSACSPIHMEGSPASTPVPMSSQPFVVLPTNPIIVVPYCFIQGASFLPGNVLPSQNAIIVLPNGTVQSLPGGPVGSNAGGIPIPISSPSPHSVMMGSHLMMHSPFPTSATPGPSGMPGGSGGIMSPNNPAFPDAKEMAKIMNSSAGSKESGRDGDGMLSPSKIQKANSRNSGRSSRSSDDVTSHHQEHQHQNRRSHSSGNNDGCDEGSMPAIDLTFRGIQPKKEHTTGGEEEKENRGEMCSSAGSRNSRNVSRDSMGALEENSRSRSVTPGTSGHVAISSASGSANHHHHHQNDSSHHQRESMSPLEKMSVGSGGKRTPRPSSASVSSSCSTPPGLCEPKLNGMMSHILSAGAKDQHEANKMMMMMLNAGAAAAVAALESGNPSSSSGRKSSKGSVDYASVLEMTRNPRQGGSSSSTSGVNGGKLSPLSTQLPGGAILTSATSSQSLAELLMTNPPELNESLAKLNPQLLMNAQRAAAAAGGSPMGFNFNLNPAFMQALSPEIAMRLLDPAYLASLQQSLQQQPPQNAPQQMSSQSSQSGKRGVSKCVECDIVFYKYENYLVHKEHYCAARTNNNSAPGANSNMAYPPSKTPTPGGSRSSSKTGNVRDNGTHIRGKDGCRMSSCSSPSKSEVDDEECISPPPPPILHQRKGSIPHNSLRKSPDGSSSSTILNKPKTKSSPQNPITSPVSISPVPSPKGFGVITSHHITNNGNNKDHHGKGGSSNNQYPCSICGVRFSTIDNLQTHQTYYCNKRKGSNSLTSGFDNNGDNEYGGNGEAKMGGSNNGESRMILGLPSPNEKELMTGGRTKSPGPGTRNGFLRCGKCKLAIPEEQMSTHIRVCLGTASPSFGNGRGGSEGVGWKCPCCDVYSPTVSAAQKHLETHTGIRAFKCLLCGYRGNTLRGMRTHIRTHFDKRVFDLLEGDYMTCITANDVEPTTSSNSSNANNSVTSPPLHPESIQRAMSSPNTSSGGSGTVNRSSEIVGGNKINKHSRYSPTESCKTVNQLAGAESPSPSNAFNDDGGSDIKMFHTPSDMMMMTMMTENDSSAENNNQQHHCNLCNYSSPYKANILKHMKLVHKVQIPLDLSDHEGLANMSMMMSRGEGLVIEDANGGQSDSSSRNSTPKSSALDYALAQGFSITSPSTGKSLSGAGACGLGEGRVTQASSSSSMSETSTRSRRGATAVPNGIVIKEESSEILTGERKCSSHSSAEDDIGPSTIEEKAQQSASLPTGPSTSPTPSSAAAAGNYCKSCDISFNYVSSFNAHKKFYCSSQVSSDTEASERAETPVQ